MTEDERYAMLVNTPLRELIRMITRVEAILDDPPVPSRMLIPVIRDVIHPERS